MRSKTTGAAAAAVVLASFWVVGSAHADPPPAPGPPPGPPPAPGAPAVPGPPPGPGAPAAPGAPAPAARITIDKDGKYTVGTDIMPGTYTSAGPANNSPCYWKRLAGDKIVDNALSKKPQTVVIDPTDTTFETNHCQPWQKSDCTDNCGAPDRTPQSVMSDLRGFLGPRAGAF